MKRAKLDSGRYERVNPSHSWNTNNIGTNVLLYHLQRHSDHHANPTRRYQALRDFKEAPVLPTGYAGMIVLTWIPQVWRKVMDKRVLRSLRRRHRPGQPAPAHGRRVRTEVRRRHEQGRGGRRMSQFICPNCEYVYDEEKGNPREGWPRRHAVRRDRPRLDVPRLRRTRAGRLPADRGVRAQRPGRQHHRGGDPSEVQRKAAERQDAATEDAEGEGQ